MLGELNEAGVSTLKAVGNVADGVKELAGWFKNEVKDQASLSKEINRKTRTIREDIAIEDLIIDLKKRKYKSAKESAKIDAKIASSDLNINSITAGE